jgi:hypothetical protein
MQKASHASIYGLIGLTGFGVAYDCGLFGIPDGHDHSALISIASATGTLGMPMNWRSCDGRAIREDQGAELVILKIKLSARNVDDGGMMSTRPPLRARRTRPPHRHLRGMARRSR